MGLYNENLPSTQDSEFLLRAMRGRKSLFSSKKLVIVREHAEQNSHTMSFHEQEFNETFFEFLKSLTQDEMKEMCGSVFDFYYRLYIAMKGFYHSRGITDYIYDQMVKTWCHDAVMKTNVTALPSGIYIFGCGRYGRIMKAAFEAHGIEVCAFLDNNENVQNTLIDGIRCIKPEKIIPYSDSANIMVAMLRDHEAIAQLKEYNCKHIYNQYEAYQLLDNYFISDIRKLYLAE